MRGCAGGWKGCEACALSAAVVSTAPFRLYSASQSRAQRVNFENSNHLVDASFQTGKLTNCYELKWSGCVWGASAFRTLLRHPEGPVFSLLTAHSWGGADLSRLNPPQGTCGGTCSAYQKDTNDPCPQSGILVPLH